MRARTAAQAIFAVAVAAVTTAAFGTVWLFSHQYPAPRAALPPPSSAPPQAGPLPSGPEYLGVFERGVPSAWAPVASFAQASGVSPRLAVYYSGWGGPFQARFATAAYQHNATVLVQLEPRGQAMTRIAKGADDAYLRSYASQVRSFGRKVILSFAPEADGPWYAWGYGRTPAGDWVAAWRHVVAVFRQAGAVNVTWLWDVNRATKATGPLRDWWPGAKYVDWVGIDGYYFFASDTYQSVFGKTVKLIRRFTTAPILLSEAAVGTTTDRDRQIAGLFAGMRRDRLLGLVWFDAAQHQPPYHQDWRLEHDPAAMSAFHAAALGVATSAPAR